MMQVALAKLLETLARSERGADSLPGFLFLDPFGEEVASGFAASPRPAVAFRIEGSGEPEPKQLPEGTRMLLRRVEVYGNLVGFLVTLYRDGEAERAQVLSDLGRSIAAFAAEKNFELDDLSAALNRLFEERAFLYEITAELGDSADLPDFCVRLAKRIASILEAPRALVFLATPDRREYRVAGAYGLEASLGKSFEMGEGVSGEVIASGRPKLIEEIEAYTGVPLSDLEGEARRCLLSAPIASGTSGGGLGALCVMDGGRSGSFTSEEAKLLSFIAEYVASLVSGLYLVELKKEVQIAQRIIESLLPDGAPEVPGFALAGRLTPARVVGGDYYDYLPMAGGKTGVVVADVSGHTLSATLLMTVARAAFRWAAADSEQASPAEILETVSRRLHQDLSSAEFFMSMFLVVLGEEGRVSFASAGHPPALLYRRRTGAFEELDAEGMAAGLIPGIRFEEKPAVLEEGDLLLLYTDGITEAMRPDSDEMFGLERLKQAVRAASELPPEKVVEAVFRAVNEHCEGGASDDLTVVVVKGAPVSAAVAGGGAAEGGSEREKGRAS